MTLLRSQTARPARSAFIAILLIAPAILLACPLCDSQTGLEVRKEIFGADFWETLVTVVSPFPILMLCIAAYHYGLPKLGRRSRSTQRTPSIPHEIRKGRYEQQP